MADILYSYIYAQVLFDKYFQRVLVLEDHFNVYAEEVFAVMVLTAHVAESRQRHIDPHGQ